MKDNKKQIKASLLEMGFSDKESDVYIAILELGKGTVTNISRKAGINRTTGYDILTSLTSKGVVNVLGKEPKQEYAAESPELIKEYLNKKKTEAEENIKKADDLISELNLIYTSENRPKIKFYEGINGLKTVYEDTLTSSEPIRAYATIDDMHRTLPNYFPEYYKRRAAKGIFIRGVVPKTKLGIDRSKYDKEEMREIAFVPADKYYFSPEINIYDNKIMIASWREKLGIIIESEEISDALKKMFELSWAEAKRIDKENS